jgi:hypothetical protein
MLAVTHEPEESDGEMPGQELLEMTAYNEELVSRG